MVAGVVLVFFFFFFFTFFLNHYWWWWCYHTKTPASLGGYRVQFVCSLFLKWLVLCPNFRKFSENQFLWGTLTGKQQFIDSVKMFPTNVKSQRKEKYFCCRSPPRWGCSVEDTYISKMEFEKQEAGYLEKLKVSYKSLQKCICVNTIKAISQPTGFHLLVLGKP